MKARIIFVTGTGTGVGKTLVTGLLLHRLRNMGINAATMKPVQTGPDNDLQQHWEVAQWRPPMEHVMAMSPYRFQLPASPHLAAREEKAEISLSRIVDSAHSLANSYEMLLIEGAGGVLVPLSESETMRELMIALGAPVLVVSALGLGAINHALTSLEVLAASELHAAGLVFSEVEPTPPGIAEDNPRIVAQLSGAAIRALVPHTNVAHARSLAATWDLEWTLDEALYDPALDHEHHHHHHHHGHP